MHKAVEYIHEHAQVLREQHAASDELGRLTDIAADVMRQSGGIRMLQAKSHGGYETDPTDFYEWVRAVARYNPSAGWMAGVLGVHPGKHEEGAEADGGSAGDAARSPKGCREQGLL